MKKTLLIMAAGMASRYGGGKQVDGLGPNGEILMEYSISDAKKAGFNKVIFVIAPSMKDSFKKLIEQRVSSIELGYAVQSFDTLPNNFYPPADRVKPYGTVHAVLSAKPLIDSPFAVINADDFYGEQAFFDISEMLENVDDNQAVMVTYPLYRTLSMSGKVTRGICTTDINGRLISVKETYRIAKCDDGLIRSFDEHDNAEVIDPNAPASMNFWGFSPTFLDKCVGSFSDFLNNLPQGDIRAEFPLPILIDKLIKSGELSVSVKTTDSEWMGVTYREDRDIVANRLRELTFIKK